MTLTNMRMTCRIQTSLFWYRTRNSVLVEGGCWLCFQGLSSILLYNVLSSLELKPWIEHYLTTYNYSCTYLFYGIYPCSLKWNETNECFLCPWPYYVWLYLSLSCKKWLYKWSGIFNADLKWMPLHLECYNLPVTALSWES